MEASLTRGCHVNLAELKTLFASQIGLEQKTLFYIEIVDTPVTGDLKAGEFHRVYYSKSIDLAELDKMENYEFMYTVRTWPAFKKIL
jgi:hypothetical protein